MQAESIQGPRSDDHHFQQELQKEGDTLALLADIEESIEEHLKGEPTIDASEPLNVENITTEFDMLSKSVSSVIDKMRLKDPSYTPEGETLQIAVAKGCNAKGVNVTPDVISEIVEYAIKRDETLLKIAAILKHNEEIASISSPKEEGQNNDIKLAA